MAVVSPPRNPSSTLKLLRLAGYIGVAGSSSVLFLKWYSDRRIRKSEYYVKATSHFLAYQPVVDLLGEPIYFGNINLGDKRNFSTETEAEYMIPVHGSKNRGVLYTRAARFLDIDADVTSSPDTSDSQFSRSSSSPWKIESIHVSLDNRPGERVRIPLLE